MKVTIYRDGITGKLIVSYVDRHGQVRQYKIKD